MIFTLIRKEDPSMNEQYIRTMYLLGRDGMEQLRHSRVAVFGIGGVGGYTVEALARSGIGALDLIDNDTVSISNLNRQIIALHSTIGKYKVDAAAERIRDIDPDITVRTYKTFYLPETASQFDLTQYDYIVDAIDTITAKLELIVRAKAAGTPIISSMGTGNKLDPTRFEITDISKTSMCPLARVIRKECHKRGIDHLKVLYSQEDALTPLDENGDPVPGPEGSSRRSTPGSTAFVPSAAGLIIAGEVIRDLTKKN